MRTSTLFLAIAVTVVFGCAAFAATLDSSWGWNASYGAANTVDGVYGTSNMGWTSQPNAWAIYDLGDDATVSKVRVYGPSYGGDDPSTFNPTSGTLEFSNDKINWTAPIAWSAPKLESTGRTDFSECAMPEAMSYRYVRWTLPSNGRVGEILFIDAPQLAVWEANQNLVYTNNHPVWKTADGVWADSTSFGVISGDPGGWGEPYITYDLGASAYVYGFDMMSRALSGLNPQTGDLWVSNDPVSGYSKVGTWTVPDMSNYQVADVDFGLASAVQGRYVQLRTTGSTQWSEISFKTASEIPEPGSIFAVASGLIGLVGFALRKRR